MERILEKVRAALRAAQKRMDYFWRRMGLEKLDICTADWEAAISATAYEFAEELQAQVVDWRRGETEHIVVDDEVVVGVVRLPDGVEVELFLEPETAACGSTGVEAYPEGPKLYAWVKGEKINEIVD